MGTSGACGSRRSAVIASTRSVLASTKPAPSLRFSVVKVVCPPAVAVTASAPPLKVTNLNFTPGAAFSIRCTTIRPVPDTDVVAATSVSGALRAASTRSLNVLYGELAGTMMVCGSMAISATGV